MDAAILVLLAILGLFSVGGVGMVFWFVFKSGLELLLDLLDEEKEKSVGLKKELEEEKRRSKILTCLNEELEEELYGPSGTEELDPEGGVEETEGWSAREELEEYAGQLERTIADQSSEIEVLQNTVRELEKELGEQVECELCPNQNCPDKPVSPEQWFADLQKLHSPDAQSIFTEPLTTTTHTFTPVYSQDGKEHVADRLEVNSVTLTPADEDSQSRGNYSV